MRTVIQLRDGYNSPMFFKWGMFCYNVNKAHIFDDVSSAEDFIRRMQTKLDTTSVWKTAQVNSVTITIST